MNYGGRGDVADLHLFALHYSYKDSILLLPILQSAMWDDPRRTLLALCFPSRDPSGYLRAAVCALYVDRRDNACPVERKRKTRELEERTMF
jgi:hypothetical protein